VEKLAPVSAQTPEDFTDFSKPHLSPIRRAGDKKEARKVYDKQKFFRVFPRILYRAAAICVCSAVSPPFSFFFFLQVLSFSNRYQSAVPLILK